MRELGFIKTITEDDEIDDVPESSDSDEEAVTVKKKSKKKVKKGSALEFEESFEFNDQNEEFNNWALDPAEHKPKAASSTLDEKIAKIRRKRKQENKEEEQEEEEDVKEEAEGDSGEEESDDDDDEPTAIDTIKTKQKKKKKGKVDPDKIQYAEEVSSVDDRLSFQDMNLSRPLMKALSAMKFVEPTPIQKACIPVALLGKDICACAATGTGKTAAFMLPVLERLLYKPKELPVTRVLVLTPTRELGQQIYEVSRQLAQYTKIDVTSSIGGTDLRAQEAALRLGPDVVIATAGRLIDHLHNAPSFNLNSVEILILDEADRMLDEYFAEQMKEIIKLCSRTRQTMLFSATMTEMVQDLVAVSLTNPVKIYVNENTEVALNLRQEFVRIRENREGDREAVVAALVRRTFPDHCIVFIQTKKQAHRMHVLLGLLGINVAELHGNLSQPQRFEALAKFKEGEVDVLLATDVAARGLDIQNVKTVINFTMPNSFKHYIHRVGRTARAGKSGRAVSLFGEKERKYLKDIVKSSKDPIKHRVIPQDVLVKYRDKISKLEKDIEEVLQLEKEEKVMKASENQVNRAQKLIENKEEDLDGKRNWFQTHKERQQEKAALRLGDLNLLPSKKRQKLEKQIMKKPANADERAEFELLKSQQFYARNVKREKREKRKRVFEDDDDGDKKRPAKKKKNKANAKEKSSFGSELTDTSQKKLKKLRTGLSYEERKASGAFQKKKVQGNKFKSKSRYKRK